MREIKLRSYSSIDEKFYYFFDGLYHEKIINGEYIEVDAYKFDWSKAEQYIGLNDINDKEIYEGDIVESNQWSPRIYQVGFDRGGFCFYNTGDNYYNDAKYLEDFKIIGNIHEK